MWIKPVRTAGSRRLGLGDTCDSSTYGHCHILALLLLSQLAEMIWLDSLCLLKNINIALLFVVALLNDG